MPPPSRHACSRISWARSRAPRRSISSSRVSTRSTCAAGASRPTSRASTRTSSRRSRPPASARRRASPRRSSRRRWRRRPSPRPATRPVPILTGVLAKFEGSRLTLAAADNYRIAVRTIDILDPVEAASVVIPARALNELSRILSDTDDPVELVLATSSQPGAVPPGRDRPRVAPHRRPVPQLPAGAPGEPCLPGRDGPRGAPPGRPPCRADRELVGQHRQAPGGRRRIRHHGHCHRRGRRLHG